MSSVKEYLRRLEKGLFREDGDSVAIDIRLFNTMNVLIEKRFQNELKLLDEQSIYSVCEQYFEPGDFWFEIIQLHLIAINFALNVKDFNQAFQTQVNLCSSVNRVASNLSNWFLPVLHSVNNDLIRLAEKTSDKNANLEEAARTLNKTFTICLNDRAELPVSRKWGTYQSMNNLFKVYFRLKQHNLCSSVIRAINNAELPGLEEFPKSHIVTFRFYTGLLAFLDENYTAAQENFVFALKHCHKFAKSNKRRILHYLIPVNLMFRERPSLPFLQRYDLDGIYGPIMEYLKLGQLHKFQDLLAKHEKTFLKKGTFLIWEKVTFLVYRQLFYRTFKVLDSQTKLAIDNFKIGLQVAEKKVSSDEVQCLLANMIEKGFIKGYISFEKQFLVLSQKDPFPELPTE